MPAAGVTKSHASEAGIRIAQTDEGELVEAPQEVWGGYCERPVF
jgi:hypothetical protein